MRSSRSRRGPASSSRCGWGRRPRSRRLLPPRRPPRPFNSVLPDGIARGVSSKVRSSPKHGPVSSSRRERSTSPSRATRRRPTLRRRVGRPPARRVVRRGDGSCPPRSSRCAASPRFGWLRHRNGPPRVERDDRTASGAATDARGTPEPVVSATERVVPSLAPTIASPTLSPDAGATVAPREVQAAAGASGRSRHPDRAISREEPAAATNDPSRPTSRDATATDSSPSVTRPPEARGRAGVLHADDF